MYGQGFIPDDFDGEYCRYAVCWPSSPKWLAVLRGVLTIPAQGRFWDEKTGTITEAQAQIRETFDTNLHLEEVIMACNDEGLQQIAEALQALANAQNSCCGDVGGASGSGGGGAFPPPASGTEEGDPNTDDPPEGYDSWEQFFNQKCAVARDIINKMQRDLGEMALYNFGVMSVETLTIALGVLLTLTISTGGIIAIAALLLSVGATIILTTALSILNDNEEELVCALFNGQSSSDSRSSFLTLFAEYVDTGVSDPIQNYAIKALVGYMLEVGETNRLYERDLTRVFPSSDCEACEPCGEVWEFNTEGDTEGWEATTTFPSCFGLGSVPLVTLGVTGGANMYFDAISSGSYYKGGIKITGLEIPLVTGWSFTMTLRRTVASSAYIDAVFYAEDDTCIWTTLDNDFNNSGFADVGSEHSGMDGKTLTEIYIFFQSNSGASGMTIEIDQMVLTCE